MMKMRAMRDTPMETNAITEAAFRLRWALDCLAISINKQVKSVKKNNSVKQLNQLMLNVE